MNFAAIATAAPRTRTLGRAVAELRELLPGSMLQLADNGQRGSGSQVVGKFYGAYISTLFQPWSRPADGTIVAYEAYARSQSSAGAGLSPWQAFANAAVDSDLVNLDRLSRTVHAFNYFASDNAATVPRTEPLVLNVDARLLHAVAERHGEFFGKVLNLLGVPPERIVIDIHTNQLLDLSRLKQILASYRRHGFAVAVNAEGMLHARTLANLLAPEYLMLDASVLSPESLARHAGSLVRNGVRVAVKRIETARQLAAAIESGVDWVQGFHLDETGIEPASASRKYRENP